MGAIETVAITDIRSKVSAEEWAVRVQVAAHYRLMVVYGMTDIIYNHITARVPDTEHILINAYGLMYNEVCASNLVKIDLDGNVVLLPHNELAHGINPAGSVIHTAIHRAREDVVCVAHTHTRAGTAVSSMEEGLLPLTQTALRFYGRCGYHDFEGPAIDLDEQQRLVRDLASHDVLVLRNHGLLAVGGSVPETFNRILWLENACRIQVDAMTSGAKLRFPTEEVQRKTGHLYDPKVRRPYGIMEWPAMLRQLDRIDPSYRD